MPKKVRWLYYLSVVLGWLIYLLSPTCWLLLREDDEVYGGDNDQRDERTTLLKNVCWLYYLSVIIFFGCYLFGLPHAGYGRGIMTRKMVVATTGRADSIAEERTLAILPVCCLFFCCCYLFGVSHILHGYGGGTTTRRMVATTMGREDNITEESTLAMLPVCCLLLFFCLFVVSRMPANGGRTATRRMFYVDKRPDGSTFNRLVL